VQTLAKVETPSNFSEDLEGKNVIICDDTVNTGTTIKKIIKKLIDLKVNDIKILSLIMRRGAPIVPNFYAFEADEDTRVLFPWSDHPLRAFPMGIVRTIAPEDCSKSFKCTDERINKNSMSDYYNNFANKGAKVYVVEEKGEIRSIIQFYEKKVGVFKGLYMDVIATAIGHEKKGYARTLLNLILLTMLYHEYDFILGYAFDTDRALKMYERSLFDIVGSVNDPEYGKLHKIVKVNTNKNEKHKVISELRKN
jgi:hypoxanthine phosphoribosyltransferase